MKEMKTIASKEFKVSRFTVVEDKIDVNGQAGEYSYIKIRPGVCVIVETDDGFVLLKEYRYPIKQWSYEFAAGIIDDGEVPIDAAMREVQEETGFIVDKITGLGEFYPSFGATDEVIHLFYARCYDSSNKSLEFSELIEYELVSEGDIDTLIANDKFKHGAGLAAWLKFKLLKI